MGGDGGLKVDAAVASGLANIAQAASKLERRGYDCCWTAEINHDPFLPLVLAAEHTTRIELGTSIAVAFARNPMTVANVGWDLQAYSDGRFILGLGSQVQAHIEKRFSMPWSQPVRRMREFVLAGRLEAALRGRFLHPQDHDADVHPRAPAAPIPKGVRRRGRRGDDRDVR
jgi:alkanesulfonate monooxygenase SsuD/methylene tetrahydromethanopterin reductase-like flavin-dependent oxidoreductase (luciferase family)